MCEVKNPNFGALVIDAISKSEKNQRDIYCEISQSKKPNHAQFSKEAIFNRPHRTPWCLRVCEVLHIDAITAYESILKDRDLLKYTDIELIRNAPQAYLERYQFMTLKVKQTLNYITELEAVNATDDIIRELLSECRRLKAQMQDMQDFLDRVPLLSPVGREVLRLRFFQGLTTLETSHRMGYTKRYADYKSAEAFNILAEYGPMVLTGENQK